ncbi:MAG TPA: alkaline phosphatase family protein, partial [Candidatus Acidoferrales bacterium]|nr:alkaline phosphatase family protein [Candidatus Acidoferrales bacterium]
ATAGCSFASSAPPSGVPFVPQAQRPVREPTAIGKYIKHVVIIIQENRTFDNVFDGFPRADTVTAGKCGTDTFSLRAIPFVFPQAMDMVHNFQQAVTAWNDGAMNQFCQTQVYNHGPGGTFPYAYLERRDVAPYWSLAHQYTLADHMFPMEFGPSFTSHLALIAGIDNVKYHPMVAEANYPESEPWGCDSSVSSPTWTVNERREVQLDGPRACFTQFRTMADSLDAAHVPWHFYAPTVRGFDGGQLWSSFDAIKAVRYGPDWANVISPQTRVLQDAKDGKLPAMSWVVPDWLDSDHPAANSDTGPSWVASVVNAIGRGPDWSSTAIFLLWDDWGGWYDNAAPPQKDFRGLGIRVPLVVISPYARKGYVDHQQYESASLLKFAEETFGLPRIGDPSLGYTDTRAVAPVEAFDFTQKPRAFVPIEAKYPASYFLRRPPSGHVVDEE